MLSSSQMEAEPSQFRSKEAWLTAGAPKVCRCGAAAHWGLDQGGLVALTFLLNPSKHLL